MSRPRGYWQQSAQDLAILHDPDDSNHKGYIRVRRNNRLVLLHVFIWEHFNGPIPTGYEIDHLNGVRWDCRLDNLRCVPKKTNTRNQSKSIKNTSGVTGVCRSTRNGYHYWVARWCDPITGTDKDKAFSVLKYGEEQAKQLAIKYREEILKDLIKNHGYTERHGK